MVSYFVWFKVAHIVSVISWMAGMFYLPRLYVYHCQATVGSPMDTTFQKMEYRLLKYIINPSMIFTYVFGIIVAYIYGFEALEGWFHIKMLAVLGLTILHVLFSIWRKDFAAGSNKHSEKFYRIINEVPVLLMIIAVIMVVVKPFE